MTTKTRYFAIVSLLVLTVGLGTGLLAYYVGFSTSAFSRDQQPDELKFVPPNATLVAYAEVRQIMTSPLRQKLRTLLPDSGHGQQDFETQTGINIETDIDHVLATIGEQRDPSGKLPGSAMVLARGRFDVVKIEGLMREHGGQVLDYKGTRMIDGDQTPDHPSLSLAFLEPGLIVVGSSNLVRTAVDLGQGGANVTSNSDLMNLIRDLDSGNAWAVGRFDVLASQARLPSGVSQNLPAISPVLGEREHRHRRQRHRPRRGARRSGRHQPARRHPRRHGAREAPEQRLSAVPGRPQLTPACGGTGKTVALSFDLPSEVFDVIAGSTRNMSRPGRRLRSGSRRFGLSDSVLASYPRATRSVPAVNGCFPAAVIRARSAVFPMTDLVFFYGTLMSGFRRQGRARLDHALKPVGRGWISAALFDLGIYPAAIPATDTRVWGEVHQMLDIDSVLATLDEIEGYSKAEPDASLYTRAEIPVTFEDDRAAYAWVYFYNAPLGASQQYFRIESGDFTSSTFGSSNPDLHSQLERFASRAFILPAGYRAARF